MLMAIITAGVFVGVCTYFERESIIKLAFAAVGLTLLIGVAAASAESDYICNYSGAGNVAKCWLK